MADNVEVIIGAGLQVAQYTRRGSDGTARGIGNLSATDTGSVSGPNRYAGGNNIGTQLPDTNKVPIPGDDIELAKFQFDAGSPEIVFAGASIDMNLINAAIDRPIYTPDSGPWDMIGMRNDEVQFNDLIWIFTQQSQSQDSDGGTVGAGGYDNAIFFNTQVKPLGWDNMAYQAASQAQWAMVVNYSETMPWGEAIDDTNIGGTKENYIIVNSESPLTLVTLVGDGTLTTFTLPLTPIDTDHARAWDESGTLQAISSVTPASDEITFATAPTSGAIVNVLYETSSL